MITAPNMPLAMCTDIGIVEQWYSHIPARVAVNRYTSDSPGAIVRIGRSGGASAPAWKSIECPIVPSLTSVISKTSPIRPRSVGPGGAVPPNVHNFCVIPPAPPHAPPPRPAV